MAPPSAVVWKFYDEGKRCLACGKPETVSKNAENHLRNHHAEVYRDFEEVRAKFPRRIVSNRREEWQNGVVFPNESFPSQNFPFSIVDLASNSAIFNDFTFPNTEGQNISNPIKIEDDSNDVIEESPQVIEEPSHKKPDPTKEKSSARLFGEFIGQLLEEMKPTNRSKLQAQLMNTIANFQQE